MTRTAARTSASPRLVGDICQPELVSADLHDRLRDVAGRMRDRDIGAVVVFDGADVAGILTERDLLEAVADGAPLDRTVAADYLITEPITVEPGTTLAEAGRIMWEAHVRHLLVVDGERVAGMISARDLLGSMGDRP
jgi:CBS domain-containing protein